MNNTLSNKNSFYYPQEVQKIPSSDQENLGLIQFDDTASVGQSKNNNMESYFLTNGKFFCSFHFTKYLEIPWLEKK